MFATVESKDDKRLFLLHLFTGAISVTSFTYYRRRTVRDTSRSGSHIFNALHEETEENHERHLAKPASYLINAFEGHGFYKVK